ncbi:ATP-binding protein [Nonomuraea sp. MTCD27]|uniref:ATP-binding protein n=1 Tax=Nonomuraea sp. MTCD27 TaxID=1676747 RepID=UPI0035C2078D
MAEFRLHWQVTNLALTRANTEIVGLVSGLNSVRLQDLVITVNEAVTNALEHGAGPAMVTLTADEVGVAVEVTDSGNSLEEHHLQLEPGQRPSRGMGLWIIRQLADQIKVDRPPGQSRLRFRVNRVAPAGVVLGSPSRWYSKPMEHPPEEPTTSL